VLGEHLLGKWASVRRTARELAGRPEVHKIEGLTSAEHRARCFDQLHYLVENQAVHRAFPTSLGGHDDHGGNVAGFEELVVADPSLQIKAGVQWGLFGAAVLHLGTRNTTRRGCPAS
jgi:acyl-CoA oxidase